MTYDKALSLAIKQLQNEKRLCLHYHEMFNGGSAHGESVTRKSDELAEAILALKWLRSEIDDLTSSVIIQETIEKILNVIH